MNTRARINHVLHVKTGHMQTTLSEICKSNQWVIMTGKNPSFRYEFARFPELLSSMLRKFYFDLRHSRPRKTSSDLTSPHRPPFTQTNKSSTTNLEKLRDQMVPSHHLPWHHQNLVFLDIVTDRTSFQPRIPQESNAGSTAPHPSNATSCIREKVHGYKHKTIPKTKF